jgi:hypothetical protein
MRLAVIFASLLALLLSLVWLIQRPAFDSAVAVVTALSALLSAFFLKRERKSTAQVQHVSNSSLGIQAGRDVHGQDIKNQ